MSSTGKIATTLLLGVLVTSLAGCEGAGPLDQMRCERTLEAEEEAQLTELLSGARRGDCVRVARGEYAGSYTLPAGVALVGNDRQPPRFLGGAAGEPALILEGGEGSLVAQIEVEAREGHGLMVVGGPARVQESRLSAPKGLALILRCLEAGCDAERIEIVQNEIHDSLNGVVVRGVNALLEDNTLHTFDGVSIEAGIGLAVSGGATLTADRNEVTGAGEVAVLLDGAETVGAFTDLSVVENRGRGVWAQYLRGSAEAPALTIDGPGSQISGNSIVGLGAIDAVGIIMGTCIVRDTAPIDLVTDLGVESVGDGIGLFGGTSEVTLGDGLSLSGNARAGILVDQGGTSIIMGTVIVEPGRGGFGIVVQRTTSSVTLDPSLSVDDPGSTLGVADAALNVPGA